MQLRLPDFSDHRLRQLSFAIFSNDASFVAKIQQRFGGGEGTDFKTRYGAGHGLTVFACLFDEDAGLLYLSADREASADLTVDRQSEIHGYLREFEGIKGHSRQVADYFILNAERPKKGIIPALSISTQIASETVSLLGGRLKLSGEPYSEMEWSTTPNEDLSVKLLAASELLLDQDTFVRTEATMKKGLERFVFAIEPTK
jgi:hypothetical protein